MLKASVSPTVGKTWRPSGVRPALMEEKKKKKANTASEALPSVPPRSWDLQLPTLTLELP